MPASQGKRPSRRSALQGSAQAETSSRDLLLAAARHEFATKGFEGARVDAIAQRAGVNKQLVYHHFGSKEDLYGKVLELAYDGIRERERALDLERLSPVTAMRRLIETSFDYLCENRDFVALLTDENLHRGRHLKRIAQLQSLNSPLIGALRDILKRGEREKIFRKGLDPLQVYISIAGLGFFYFNNIYTLTTIFGQPLETPAAVARRRRHVVDFVLHALRP